MWLELVATCALSVGITFTPPPGWQVVRVTAEVVHVSWEAPAAEIPRVGIDAPPSGRFLIGDLAAPGGQVKVVKPTVTVILRKPVGDLPSPFAFESAAFAVLDPLLQAAQAAMPECTLEVREEVAP